MGLVRFCSFPQNMLQGDCCQPGEKSGYLRQAAGHSCIEHTCRASWSVMLGVTTCNSMVWAVGCST